MAHKEFDSLKHKYSNLPSYEIINQEFEISELEGDFISRQIIKKIQEKLDTPLKIVEQILQPDISSFSEMFEMTCFTEEDKKNISNVYKKLMIIYRNLMEAEVKQDEEHDVKVITETAEEFPQIRNECAGYLVKLKSCWTGTEKGKDILEYLG